MSYATCYCHKLCVKNLILLLNISISISLHSKFTASSGRAIFMSRRKLGEISNITRRNSETTIINHGRIKFRSWKNMNNKKKGIKVMPCHLYSMWLQQLKCNSIIVSSMRKKWQDRAANIHFAHLAYWH